MTKTKTCQNCKTKFFIAPEDFEFYKKINVPEPSFCPDCRLQRRLAFRNERKLYKRKCDFSNKEIISIYRKDSPYKVYDQKIWWSDKWDALEYGRDYDFKKPFFEQFRELMRKVPWQRLRITKSVNCEYCHGILESKNCYLVDGYKAEDCLYMEMAIMSKECLDSSILFKVERAYESIDCNNSYNLSFCTYCDNCLDSVFLYDCRNCSNCFACSGLRSKKYHIFNKPYNKTEYKREIKKWDLGNYRTLLKVKQKFQEFNQKIPKAWAKIVKSVNVTGDNVQHSKNCQSCFGVRDGAEDCKYLFLAGLLLKDSYDVYAGAVKSELIYETNGLLGSRNVLASDQIQHCFDVTYSASCFSSSNLFACIGLRHKQYCIFNKQYTKQEYNELVPRIIDHMNKMPYTDKKGRVYKYGEFFPIELSLFAYNETIANEYFPLSKQQAIKQGYTWYNKPKAEYKPTIKAKDLPDNIKDVYNSILKEIIECGNVKSCAGSGVFRIIPNELKFYKKMNLPIPRLCPDCRHRERIKQRNPLKLWKRKCAKCGKEIQTTYAPDRPEIVYCEKCYLGEIG